MTLLWPHALAPVACCLTVALLAASPQFATMITTGSSGVMGLSSSSGEAMRLAPMRCVDYVSSDAEVTSDEEEVTSDDEALQLPIDDEELTSVDEALQLPIDDEELTSVDEALQQPIDDEELTSDDEAMQLPIVVNESIVASEDEELRLPIAMGAEEAFDTMRLVALWPRAAHGAQLSQGQRILRTRPLTQFVLPTGVQRPDLDQAGALDMWSGCKRFAYYCVQHGAPWVLTYDYLDDAVGQDLLESPLP